MELISTKWVNYLHEHEGFLRELKPKLFDTLYEYELKKFLFELEEGYEKTDAELAVFPRFIFTYIACYEGKNVVVKIGTGQAPTVETKNKTVHPTRIKRHTRDFSTHFHLTEVESDELQDFFDTFGQLLLRA